MSSLADYTTYADAQEHFSRAALWDLFDGTREALSIPHECVDRYAELSGDAGIAVRVAHASGRDEIITFNALAALSTNVAGELIRRGVNKGDRVAVMLDPSLPFYAALFGIMKAGAVVVPLFTLFGPEGMRLRLQDCSPSLLLLAPEKRDLAVATDIPVLFADDEWLESLSPAPDITGVTHGDDMALFQYTSGTTRELPDAVRHRHRAIVTVAVAALYATGVRPGDRFMCPSSPAWGHGLWHGTLAPLALGVNIAAYSGKFDPDRLMQALVDYRITNLSAAATHYRMMKQRYEPARYDFRLQKLSFTGEPLDSATAAWAENVFGHEVCSIYGTTEVGVILSQYPGAADFVVKRGALGRPLPGVEVAVMDDAGAPCAPETIGEICVHRGGEWLSTHDLGHVDKDGDFFHHGRADDVIISAGWTMSAVEIEDTLLQHGDVDECAAIGVADPVRGLVVRAYVVSRRAGDDEFANEIQGFAQTRLARHEYPRQLRFVENLPKTPAGKVNRAKLRASALEEQESNKL